MGTSLKVFVLICLFIHSVLNNHKLESICSSEEGIGDQDPRYFLHSSSTPFICPPTCWLFLGHTYWAKGLQTAFGIREVLLRCYSAFIKLWSSLAYSSRIFSTWGDFFFSWWKLYLPAILRHLRSSKDCSAVMWVPFVGCCLGCLWSFLFEVFLCV